MRQVNRQCDLAHPMRLFRHGPFRLDAQACSRDLMAVTVSTYKITHTTGDGTDKQFDGTHPGILPAVFYRLIRDDAMCAARNVVASPTMVCGCEFHVAFFLRRS
jgi:hypothetical protein